MSVLYLLFYSSIQQMSKFLFFWNEVNIKVHRTRLLARWREHWRIMVTKSRAYPSMKVDEGMRNSGFRLEGRQHPFAKLRRLIPEHYIPRESVTSEQTSHETNIGLKQRYFGVLKQCKTGKMLELITCWSFIREWKKFNLLHVAHTHTHIYIHHLFVYDRLL